MVKRTMIISILLMLILFIAVRSSSAYDVIPFGSARALGLAGAMQAMRDNNDSMFYNPAAVNYGEGQAYSIGMLGGDWNPGHMLSYSMGITDEDVIGVGMDQCSSILSTETRSIVYVLSFAHRINAQLSVGLAAMGKSTDFSGYMGNGYSANLGLYYDVLPYLKLGMTVINAVKTDFKTGTNSSEAMPTGVALGLVVPISDNPILRNLCVDIIMHDFSASEHGGTSDNMQMNIALDMRVFDLKVWKGWSYSKYDKSRDRGPWVEPFGIGYSIFKGLDVEYANYGENNIYSIKYKMPGLGS